MPTAFATSPPLHTRTTTLTPNCPARPRARSFQRRYRFRPTARVSDSRHSYRLSSLLATTKSRTTTSSLPLPPTVTAPAKAPLPSLPSPPKPQPKAPPRYFVRPARSAELYTVADIRCSAFYGDSAAMTYYPVRRREIYMAMRDRLASGNRCLVVVDTSPPDDWMPFANEDGHLVVGSLDASMHGAASGKRFAFGENVDAEGKRIYISSMAVRDAWQRRGLARMLLQHVDDLAHQFQVGELFLHVEWENWPAVALYSSCGFLSTVNDDPALVPNWLHFLAKKEHTLMRKRASKPASA